MNSEDSQLIEAVVQQVMRVLAQHGAAPGVSGGSPASIHPPAGVCTGDDSKFKEPNAVAQSISSQSSAPLTGFVTEAQLLDAVEAAPDRIAVLAAHAKLTPLAHDYVREHPQSVRRASTSQASTVESTAPSWLWWADGRCDAVDRTVALQGKQLRPASAGRTSCAVSQVVRDLAASIKAGRAVGGLLFVRHAALAMCCANRCASLRAVLGTCKESVEQGVSELGANVLVIEYPFVEPNEMSAMIEIMLRRTGAAASPPSSVQRLLADLHRC